MKQASYQHNVGLAFAAVVGLRGDCAALRFQNGIVTYSELDTLANQMAQIFAARGVTRHKTIAIVHSKSALCFAAVLGALKLGAPYVCLDEENPPSRMRHIFAASQPKLVVGESLQRAISSVAESQSAVLLDLDKPEIRRELAAANGLSQPDLSLITGSDPAYIMFTSGSTGVPKGVLISHANVLNFAAWCRAAFDISSADVLSNVNPMYFDNSVFDVYAALLNGASIAPIARNLAAEPAAMIEQLESTGCTIWFSVPSQLIYLMTLKVLSAASLPTVRLFLFGGEGYPKPELRKLFALFSSRCRLVNVYGPTECTCICSAWDVQLADLDGDGLVRLGPIADNFATLVLAEDDRPAAAGEVGELCLLGPQVGLGYVNDPQRTGAVFAENPLNAAWHERMYRTGDLVKVRPDCTLDFIGRKDNQIKHLGYRIELEEIEAALHQIEGITQAAVLYKAARRGPKVLIAYLAVDRELSSHQVRAELMRLLPPYMIPRHFVTRPALPKNANGKIDRLALDSEPLETFS